MAVATNENKPVSSARRMLVGTNVAVVVLIVAAIVGVVQALAYNVQGARLDMTSSGVNSLSEATVNLLRNLDDSVRLTSLYFETDREEPDQQRYRQTARNLLELYEAANRGKITADTINPLKEREKFQKMAERLRSLPGYKDAVDAHQARVDEYKNKFDDQIRALLRSERSTIATLTGASLGGGQDQRTQQVLAGMENFFSALEAEVEAVREQIDAFSIAEIPQLGACVGELQSLYRKVGEGLKKVNAFVAEQLAAHPQMPAAAADFLRDAGGRYGALLAEIEAENTKLEELPELKLDSVLVALGPTNNAIVVETQHEARVVDFSSVWPPLDPSGGARVGFEQRAFKGEEKLTSAILRATHKEQTAVVFVRYGGIPLLAGGFMPGQPGAPYAQMKHQLEDANFIVEEWDLKTTTTPPKIDPAPTRTIFVVFKPTPPERGPMGQPSQEPPFAEIHREALHSAMGENGRAIFVAGWAPGPFGPIPSNYEYGDYLKETWGIEVDTSALLLKFTSINPGEYGVAQGFFIMDQVAVHEHDIVSGAHARQVGLPWCAPLNLSANPPEGVTHHILVTQPQADGVWGVKNIQRYEDQLRDKSFVTRIEGDLEGPFDLAVAAAKGDAKIVVISARDFAADQIAFATEMSLGPRGLIIRSRNPGNVSLLVNSLHWLNDNTQFMNIGKPIDAAVLEIDKKSTETFVRVLTIAVWPALALGLGGVTWWVRRK